MPKIERVDDEIRKILNEIIAHEMKDPRLDTLINVTEVQTTKDLKSAKVYVSVMDVQKQKDAVKALNAGSSFIRGLLFDRIKIRLVPHLTFILDMSMEKGYRMEKIKVIIADDSDFVRDGMKIILDVDDDFLVLGTASNGKEAIELAKKETPDVFLMDI